uniref:Putative secreted protein n=1 Tax=Anopheles darlingi TaxID=43151 RepID=A0A2M4DEX7_ANODA
MARLRLCRSTSLMFWPLMRICPVVGSKNRYNSRTIEDFPEPDPPTMATFAPAGMVKERSLKMSLLCAYRKPTLRNSIEDVSRRTSNSGALARFWMALSTPIRVNMVRISSKAWRTSRYTLPRNPSGIDN